MKDRGFWNSVHHLLCTRYDMRFFLGSPTKIYHEDGGAPVAVDWKSLVVIFLFIGFLGYFIGYPIALPDTSRYTHLAIDLKPHFAVSEIYSLLARPILILGGPWLYIVLLWIVCAYLVTVLSQYVSGKVPRILSCWSIFSSGAFLMLTTVMMDIQTTLGLMALFLLGSGSGNILLFIVFIISITAHLGNLYVFFLAYIALLILRRVSFRKHSFYVPFVATFIALMLIGLGGKFLNGEFRIKTKVKLLIPSVELMRAIPESVQDYSKEYPYSIIGLNRNRWKGNLLVFGSPGMSGIGTVALGQFDSENYFWFTVKHYPWRVLAHSIYQTWDFLVNLQLREAFWRPPGNVHDLTWYMSKGDEANSELGLQKRGLLDRLLLNQYYSLSFFICTIAIFLYVLYHLVLHRNKSQTFFFCAFVILAVLINAAVMSNAAGVHGRYQAKVFLLPLLAFSFMAQELAPAFEGKIRSLIQNRFPDFRPLRGNVIVVLMVFLLPVLFVALLHRGESKAQLENQFSETMEQVIHDTHIDESGFYAYYAPDLKLLFLKADAQKAKIDHNLFQVTFYKDGKRLNNLKFWWDRGGTKIKHYQFHLEPVPQLATDSLEVTMIKDRKPRWSFFIKPMDDREPNLQTESQEMK